MKPMLHFPVIRGLQAGREYYLAMCSLRLVTRLFQNDHEPDVEERAQRLLNKARIPDITRYIIENPENYVLTPITASIDSFVEFKPLEQCGDDRNMGWLIVPMDAKISIIDGQHRHAAIARSLADNPALGDETIAVVLYLGSGLKKSQQLFADLNKHAVRPSQSLAILYDHRDPLGLLTRRLADEVPLFKGRIEKEKTGVQACSHHLFSLNALYQACRYLLNYKKGDVISERDSENASAFWSLLGEHLPQWQQVISGDLMPECLRRGYVNGHGIALNALGLAGGTLMAQYPATWRDRLPLLNNVNWSRSCSHTWEGRAILQGRIVPNSRQVMLTGIFLIKSLNLRLLPHHQEIENSFAVGGSVNG